MSEHQYLQRGHCWGQVSPARALGAGIGAACAGRLQTVLLVFLRVSMLLGFMLVSQ